MADAPGAGESLIKKEPDLPAYDPIVSNSTSGWMLVSALLLTLSIAWALYDEAFGQRPWKGMQREFVARYTRYLNSVKANSGKTEAEIIEHCRDRLTHFKCPTVVEFRESLARTATGKLQKFKLREPFWAGHERKVN